MTEDSTLRTWIRDHRICWELGPLVESDGRVRMQVGYELHLFAQHGPGGPSVMPGCAERRDLYERMRAVALGVLPHETRPSRYEITPFDASLHLRPENEWTPEVQLTVRVVHREGYFSPVDACEEACAKEIVEGLRKLGAQQKAWAAA